MVSETVGVCVATYGDSSWQKLADRAEKSVHAQTIKPDAVVRVHGETLAQARNDGIARLGTYWGCVLDADDLWTPEYVEKMLQAAGTLRYPMVGRVYPDGSRKLFKYMPCDLLQQNFIVIGAMFRVQDFIAVGGFDENIPIFEDWELWLRLKEYGVDIQPSEAIYVAYERPDSRNKQYDLIEEWLVKIREKHK